jgi:hypothetical protein
VLEWARGRWIWRPTPCTTPSRKRASGRRADGDRPEITLQIGRRTP